MSTYTNFRTPLWKPALGGVIAGAALYFIPFLLPLFAAVLFIGIAFLLVSGGPQWRMRYNVALANMTEEQRSNIPTSVRGHRCGS